MNLFAYDGKNYFRGLVFFYGPAAEDIPEIKKNIDIDRFLGSRDSFIHYKSHAEKIIFKIEKDNPGFFQTFKKKIESKNPETIRQTLRDASKLALNTSEKILLDKSFERARGVGRGAGPRGSAVAVTAAVVAAVVVHNAVAVTSWAAAAVTVAAAMHVHLYTGNVPNFSNLSRYEDVISRSISERYPPTR